jgi:hypothetical protein
MNNPAVQAHKKIIWFPSRDRQSTNGMDNDLNTLPLNGFMEYLITYAYVNVLFYRIISLFLCTIKFRTDFPPSKLHLKQKNEGCLMCDFLRKAKNKWRKEKETQPPGMEDFLYSMMEKKSWHGIPTCHGPRQISSRCCNNSAGNKIKLIRDEMPDWGLVEINKRIKKQIKTGDITMKFSFPPPPWE